MRKFFKYNGLSIVLFLLFIGLAGGQCYTDFLDENHELVLHGKAPQSFGEYMKSADCWEALGENWESEFLQMGFFVLLTQFLYQKGSAESRALPEENSEEEQRNKEIEAKAQAEGKTPGPVKSGGLIEILYRHSLTLVLFLLFILSFIIHSTASWLAFNDYQQMHGQEGITYAQHLGSSRLWFESLQNWQSEFLAIFAMVVLTIFLRANNSAESKPVGAAHSYTGK